MMKLINIFIQTVKLLSVLVLYIFFSITANAQKETSEKMIMVNMNLVDDNGVPLSNIKVIIGEGLVHTESDSNGSVTFMALPEDLISVKTPDYFEKITFVKDILKDNTIVLKKSVFFNSPDEKIPHPFSVEKKRLLTGSSNKIMSSQLEKYPTIDFRNSLTGLETGLHVIEMNGSPGMTAEEKLGSYRITDKVRVFARGRSMIYIIDDIPTDITEMQLDPMEVESVTIIKDIVDKTLFGPLGADGIIYIKTKRGMANERIMTVNVEDGVSLIDRMPKYVDGADYARLNNIARENDGLNPLYSDSDINSYAKNDPFDLYYPSVNFRELLLKKSRSFRKANIFSKGGSDMVKYASFLGYSGEGDNFKIGSVSDFNRLTVRSNIDMKINEFINVQFDIYGGLTFNRSPNYGYATAESSGYTNLLEFNYAINDIRRIPPNAFPVYAKNDPSLKDPWYGVSSLYPINPVGALTRNGSYIETGRHGAAKVAFDYDMVSIIPGLVSHTYLAFDAYNILRKGTAEDYFAYIVTPTKTSMGNDTILLTKVHDGVDAPQLRNLHDYYHQRYAFYEKLSYGKSYDMHYIQSSLCYFMYNIAKDGITEPQRTTSTILNLKYTYNDRYTIQGVLNYAGTYTLGENNRYGIFPSIGANWIISEESFISNIKFIDFLKIRAQAGIIGQENFRSPFLFRDSWVRSTGTVFGPYSTNLWFGDQTEVPYVTYPDRLGNKDLTWEKRKEISVGIDGLLMKRKLSVEFNYYNNLREGIITQLVNSTPYMAGISYTLPNYNNNKIRYQGFETGIQYMDRKEKFRYSFGGNATVQNSKYVKYDEPDYRFNYQKRTGRATDTYWGQTYLGKFKTDEETLLIPQLYDAVLKAGDLKYRDMNGDNAIDDNDQSALGNTSPRLYYSLNANFIYKNIELTIIGTGSAFFDLPLNNAYYWNGWGDDNYSMFVRDNIGGKYPRLTYYKVNNNFVNSDFWLVNGDYFKLQNVEVAYNLPVKITSTIGAKEIRIFTRGANLLTLSKVKDIDPESPSSGITVYPLNKTFTGGVKITF